MKRIIFSLMIFTFASSAFSDEVKLGYVDLQRAVQGTSAGKKAKAELEKEFKSKESEFKKKEGDLKKLRDDLEKKKSVLSEETRAKKEAELQQEFMSFQQEVSKSQMALQKREQDLTQPIMQKMEKALDQIAKSGKYTMIFEKSRQGLVWAAPQTDLTDELVKTYEGTKDKK